MLFLKARRLLVTTGQFLPWSAVIKSKFVLFSRAIKLDADVYPEPTTFKPDRWLDTNGRIREDLTYFTYGFGRRFVLPHSPFNLGLLTSMAVEYAQDNISQTSQYILHAAATSLMSALHSALCSWPQHSFFGRSKFPRSRRIQSTQWHFRTDKVFVLTHLRSTLCHAWRTLRSSSMCPYRKAMKCTL